MTAQVGVGLLARQDQEVGVRVAAAALEVGLQLLQPERAGVVRVAVAVEVEDVGDVDPHRPHHRYPRRRRVEAPGSINSCVNAVWKCVDHRLVAGQRLVAVAVRERHDRLAAGVARRRGSGRSRPASAARCRAGRCRARTPSRSRPGCSPRRSPPWRTPSEKVLLGVLAVPDVAEVHLQLAGEEELVRRREDGDRAVRRPRRPPAGSVPAGRSLARPRRRRPRPSAARPRTSRQTDCGSSLGEKPFSPPW